MLGQKVLAEYAEKFGFNRKIPFDMPLAVSQIEVPNDEEAREHIQDLIHGGGPT